MPARCNRDVHDLLHAQGGAVIPMSRTLYQGSVGCGGGIKISQSLGPPSQVSAHQLTNTGFG